MTPRMQALMKSITIHTLWHTYDHLRYNKTGRIVTDSNSPALQLILSKIREVNAPEKDSE